MSLRLIVQIVTCAAVPAEKQLRQWGQAALVERQPHRSTELVIRLVDEDESRQLNETYRHQRGPTNVLSFAFEPPIEVGGDADNGKGCDCNYLGDLVICAPLVAAEAAAQNKTLDAHWAHMVIHGVLHLQGYDHQDDAQAERMEGLETRLLGDLGYTDPYGEIVER